MDVGKLHRVCDLIVGEYQSKKIIELWAQCVSTLQQAISNPGNPDLAKAYTDQYAALRASAEQSIYKRVQPTDKLIFEKLQSEKFIGAGLVNKFDEIVAANRFTLAVAIPQLTAFQDEMQKYFNFVNGMLAGFKNLNIERDRIEFGQAEIGFYIPRELFSSELTGFAKEIRQIDLLLRAFNELTNNNQEKLELRKISTSSWEIFVLASVAVIKGVNWVLKQIVEMLRSLVDIKTQWEKLVKAGLPAETTDPLKNYIDSHIDKKSRVIAEAAVAEFAKEVGQDRKNELTNQLDQAIKFLASKLDGGVQIDLRISIPPPAKGDANSPEVQEKERLRAELTDLSVQALETTNVVRELSQQSSGQLKLSSPDLEKR